MLEMTHTLIPPLIQFKKRDDALDYKFQGENYEENDQAEGSILVPECNNKNRSQQVEKCCHYYEEYYVLSLNDHPSSSLSPFKNVNRIA